MKTTQDIVLQPLERPQPRLASPHVHREDDQLEHSYVSGEGENAF